MPMSLAAPPRSVPLSLQIVNFFNGAAQLGWLLFGFGMIFFWAFVGNADLSFLTFRGTVAKVQGRVTSVEQTNASVNHSHVMANHYEYNVAGEWFKGESYSTGSGPSQGENVTVEYLEDHPARSRIEGLRRAMFGPWISLITLLPLAGFAILYFAARSGARRNRLLREGILAQGTLVDKEPTNITINGRPLWEFTFEFTDRNGQRREAKCRATESRRLQDEATEPMLYDPNDPASAYVLDEAPARPQVDNGQLVGRTRSAILALILPAVMITVHGLILAFKLGVFHK